MYLLRMRSLFLILFAAMVMAAGCGEGTLSSPTAPSALSDSAPLGLAAPSGALASMADEDAFAALGGGRGQGGGSTGGSGGGRDNDKDQEKDKGDRERGGRDDAGDVDDDDDDGDDEDEGGRRPHVSGFVTAVGADSITVRGITVRITATTVIRHGHRRLALADIAVGDHAQARGTMSTDGSVLSATEVKVEDTGHDNDDADDVELKGAVAALSGTCPARTFTIGTTTVRTNLSTRFDDVTCEALANGNTVEVEGARQTDGSVLAETVELESGPSEVKGRIAGLTGTCPSLTFTIGTATVTTSGSTTFSGVACTALTNGTKVEVEGALTGTTLAASTVELD